MKLYPNIAYYLIWLISIILIFYLGFSTLPGSGKFDGNFWESFGNWDGGHYTGIAKTGYSEKFQYAFFPLYPLVIKALTSLTQNYLLSAVLISIFSSVVGAHFLYKLVAKDFDKVIATKTVLALLFFPTSFYFLTAYSEGLFFFLTVLTFYFLRKKQFFWATLAVALASATRLVGLAVVLGFLVEVLTRYGLNRKNWYVLFAPFGFVLYCIFLYKQTGDPFYFITAENHWQRVIVAPGVAFWESLKGAPNGVIDLGFAVFGVGFVLRSFRFLPVSFAIFSLVSIILPLFTPTLTSIPRFLLPVFPMFILMALIKNQYIFFFFQIISIMLLAFFSVLFILGYWVS